MMWSSPFYYFTDAVLRAPTLGSMLMCCAASLVGVIVLLRKQSLVGESLSHAAYPGVILGVLFLAQFSGDDASEMAVVVSVMVGAFGTALLGLWLISLLETKLKVTSDAALCFVLSSFFGVGLTVASHLQFTHTGLYKQGQSYLFGQVPTMTDWHIGLYGLLTIVTIGVIVLFYKEIEVLIFDRSFASTLGIPIRLINGMLFSLIVFAVVVGLRSVGVVLMSAMLIAPAVAARQFTNRLSVMFALAGIFGLCSGFLGNYLSVEISRYTLASSTLSRFSLPTGPMIVLVAAVLCILALFCAPERGFLPRLFRILAFRQRCLAENLLKSLWRFGPEAAVSLYQLRQHQHVSWLQLRVALQWLISGGWVMQPNSGLYRLTPDGEQRAAKIVRLHRLWEVYLVDYVGVGAERVHRNAEEMEHIITPQIERELTILLKDPKRDPHRQPIPPQKYPIDHVR